MEQEQVTFLEGLLCVVYEAGESIKQKIEATTQVKKKCCHLRVRKMLAGFVYANNNCVQRFS